MADALTNATNMLSESLDRSLRAVQLHAEEELRLKLREFRLVIMALNTQEPRWVAFDHLPEIRDLLEAAETLFTMSEQDSDEGRMLNRALAQTAAASLVSPREDITLLRKTLQRVTPPVLAADELHRILIRDTRLRAGYMLPSERGLCAPLDKLWRNLTEVNDPRSRLELFLEEVHELSANELYWNIMLDRELVEFAEETRLASEEAIVQLESQLILY